MANQFDPDAADAFSSALETTEEWKFQISLRELIDRSFPSITRAREKRATWEQIGAVLQRTVGETIAIKADTVRQYYFEIAAKQEGTPKKKRRKSAKARKKPKVSTDNLSTIAEDNQLPSQDSFVGDSSFSMNDSEDSESSFNTRSRRRKDIASDG